MLSRMKQAVSNRSLLVDFLAVVFGISSWISINGLWVQLPLMVPKLPEGWSLASDLSILVQAANIGPLLYSAAKFVSRSRLTEKTAISILLTVGTVAAVTLPLVWSKTAPIIAGHGDSSVGLFVLVFFLSIVDCTSSVTFVPFMATFRETYIYSFFIGEGLSGFLPSIVALAQGVGGNPYCQNGTLIYPEPRFGVEVFFSFLAAMMVASTAAFAMLILLPAAKAERVDVHGSGGERTEDARDDDVLDNGRLVSYGSQLPIVAASSDPAADRREVAINESVARIPIDRRVPPWGSPPSQRQQQQQQGGAVATGAAAGAASPSRNKREYFCLLAVQCYVCFVSNGALPSIQTYSCLPYGNLVFHLAVTLGAMANPAMAFVSHFLRTTSTVKVAGLTCLGSLFVVYIMATAVGSPDMLWGQGLGGTFTVVSWIVYGALFSYVKVSIAGIFRARLMPSSLFWYGVVTQLGSALGALLFFLVVNYGDIFHASVVVCQ